MLKKKEEKSRYECPSQRISQTGRLAEKKKERKFVEKAEISMPFRGSIFIMRKIR